MSKFPTPGLLTRTVLSFGFLAAAAIPAWATDIAGVQPASFDQPHIHSLFRTSSTDDPITYDNGAKYDVQGFLDTGTSGVLLSQESADVLGFDPIAFDSQTVTFEDIGVGGPETFNVSDPYFLSLAAFGTANNINFGGDPPPTSAYTQSFGPIRMELTTHAADPLLGAIDLFGTPIMQNKVVVMDPKPVNLLGSVSSYIYDPLTPYHELTPDTDPGIPVVDHHVQLTYASLDRFTQVQPAGAPSPTQTSSPFIGPNPLSKIDPTVPAGSAPPVSIAWKGHDTTGSFIFDTGAAESFISTTLAADLHVHYLDGTYNTDNPVLVNDANNPLPNQFTGLLGGIGGPLSVAGFYLDSLQLQTTEGDPITYLGAPVLVADVTAQEPDTLQDADTPQTLTLDGDFGVNFWVASIGDRRASASPYSWVTFDQPNGLLGFQFNPATIPEPAEISMLIATIFLLRRRRKKDSHDVLNRRKRCPTAKTI